MSDLVCAVLVMHGAGCVVGGMVGGILMSEGEQRLGSRIILLSLLGGWAAVFTLGIAKLYGFAELPSLRRRRPELPEARARKP